MVKNLLSVALGSVLAMCGAAIVRWVSPEADGQTKKVVEVRRYQEKSGWSNWQTSLITNDDSLYPYCILIAEDGSHVRVDGEPPAMVDYIYTSPAWVEKPTP